MHKCAHLHSYELNANANTNACVFARRSVGGTTQHKQKHNNQSHDCLRHIAIVSATFVSPSSLPAFCMQCSHEYCYANEYTLLYYVQCIRKINCIIVESHARPDFIRAEYAHASSARTPHASRSCGRGHEYMCVCLCVHNVKTRFYENVMSFLYNYLHALTSKLYITHS